MSITPRALLATLLLPLSGSAQSRITNADLISAQLERSYIGFSKGIGNLPNEIFEAHIAFHLPLFLSQRPDAAHTKPYPLRGVVFSMETDLRMLAVKSDPVRTPGFMPGFTFFLRSPHAGANELVTARVFHYSNGQEGRAVENGKVNYTNGSFSHDVGTTFGWSNAIVGTGWAQIVRGTADWYASSDSLTKADYGKLRFGGEYLLLARHGGLLGEEGGTQIRVWYSPDGVNRSGIRHLDVQATLMGHALKFQNSLGWFVGVYWGRDYYNINYQRGNVSSLRVGLMGVGRDYNLNR